MKYVHHHHSLSLPASAREHDHPVSVRSIASEIFFSRIEIGVLVGTLFLGVGGAYAFGQARLASAKQQFAKSFADVIQPSQLTTKHRIAPTSESCTKCHAYTGEIPNQHCEECHLDVKARRTSKTGYHGTLTGDCRTCHREHREPTVPLVPLDQAKFDHRKALFKLEGKHTEVKCDACHQGTRTATTPGIYYIGLKFNQCADCHADRHAGQFKQTCETCHSTAGWTGKNLKFDHQKNAAFSLTGLHAKVECRQCHVTPKVADPLGAGRFKGLAQDCAGCHQDPHQQQFANRCKDCHSTAGWHLSELKFAHNADTKFPLVGSHQQVACAKCHRPPKSGDSLAHAQFVGLKTACADCHQSPHRGQFTADCTQCHPSPESWRVKAPQFVHDRDTKFTLKGKHAAVLCEQCHRPASTGAPLGSAKFAGLDQACATCHQITHPDWYGTTCTSCHTPEGWVPTTPPFDHTLHTRFDLVGRHLVARCSECHNDKVVTAPNHSPLGQPACADCHGATEPHKGALGMDCRKCHSAVGWKGEDLLFDHNSMASFGLNSDHINLACVQCHKNGVWKPLDSACASCHKRMVGLEVKK
jgi:hypothetical protein